MKKVCLDRVSPKELYVIPYSFLFAYYEGVQVFNHRLQKDQRQVWRTALSNLSSNSRCFVLRHVKEEYVVIMKVCYIVKDNPCCHGQKAKNSSNELPCLPPKLEPLFRIKLIQGTQLIFRSPYRMLAIEQK